jgi:hypothetical protein
MISDSFAAVSNALSWIAETFAPSTPAVTLWFLLAAMPFMVLYLTRRKPDYGLLMCCALCYAISPFVPLAIHLLR